jgi:hypothetical protein
MGGGYLPFEGDYALWSLRRAPGTMQFPPHGTTSGTRMSDSR